jgi:hypothetical protein
MGLVSYKIADLEKIGSPRRHLRRFDEVVKGLALDGIFKTYIVLELVKPYFARFTALLWRK